MDVITGQPLYGMKIASPKPGCTSTSTSTNTDTKDRTQLGSARTVINDRLLAVKPHARRRKSGQMQA